MRRVSSAAAILKFELPADGKRAAFAFNYHSGAQIVRIDRVRVNGVDCSCVVKLRRFGSWVGLLFLEALPTGGEVEIDAQLSCGVVPAVSDIRWVKTEMPDFYPRLDPTPEVTDGVEQHSHPVHNGLYNLCIDSLRNAATSDQARAAALFWYIDSLTAHKMFLQFTFELPGESGIRTHDRVFRASELGMLGATLSDRLKARRQSARGSTPPHKRRALAYVSSMLVQPMRHWYPGFETDPAMACRLIHGIGAFAAGRLLLHRDDTWVTKDLFIPDGAPDSPVFTMFAEFGLLALEQGIDQDVWNIVTPAFIAAIELYQRAYGEHGKPKKFKEYRKSQAPVEVDDVHFNVLGQIRCEPLATLMHKRLLELFVEDYGDLREAERFKDTYTGSQECPDR